jgi:hypothetical protein
MKTRSIYDNFIKSGHVLPWCDMALQLSFHLDSRILAMPLDFAEGLSHPGRDVLSVSNGYGIFSMMQMMMKALHSLETTHPVTGCHTPEGVNLHFQDLDIAGRTFKYSLQKLKAVMWFGFS